jgi:probable phosphoglycerate mutase
MKRHSKLPAHRPRLFDEPERPADLHTAHIDGAARGNPGPASYAVIFRRPDGSLLKEISKYIGRATNNVAEYYALIAALDFAAAHRIGKLRVLSDSELLVRQMQGLYKVKNADLRPLFERARRLAGGLAYFAIDHVRREANRDADRLANEALENTASDAARPQRHGDEALATRTIRARYKDGALRPLAPLDLPDGAFVDLTIHPRREE